MAENWTRFGVTYANVPSPQALTQGDGDGLENDAVLLDTTQYLILAITMEQYTNLLSAALDGANRHWPEKYIEIIYPLIKAAKLDAQLCAAIAACIADPESGTYDALNQWLAEQLTNNQDITDIIDGSGGNQSSPVTINSEAMYSGCDLDNLFGFALQLTKMMNTLIEDFYQKLEEKTNFLEALPVITQEVNAFAYFVEWVEFLLNSVRDSYFSNYDLAYENEVACDLFCLAQATGTCTITWDDVFLYFVSRIGAGSAIETLSDLLTFLVTGSWSGTQICDLSMVAFSMVMRIGAVWSGIDLSDLHRIVSSFWNDPNPDWAELCDSCVWEYDIDWTAEQGDWAVISLFASENQGTYVEGTGWRTTWKNNGTSGNDSSRAVGIGHTVTPGGRYTHIDLTFDMSNSGHWDGTTNDNIFVRAPTQNFVQVSAPGVTTGTNKHFVSNGVAVAEGSEFIVSLISGRLWQNTDPGGQVTLKHLTVRGTGNNPFE